MFFLLLLYLNIVGKILVLLQSLDMKNFVTCVASSIIICAVFQEPKDRAVFAGEHARFSCATNYDISIQWRMYGANLNELIINGDATVEEKTGTATNRHHLTLKILGRAIFNGTKLQCVTQDGQVSRVATLYVKGMGKFFISMSFFN